jgi:hypothetical protein
VRRRRRRHRLEVDRLEDRVLLAMGLVAAYGFNEGSGTTVGDASGNGNGGAISNASWVQGKSGTSLKFTGAANSYVSIPDAPSLDLTNGLTVEAWVDPSSLTSPDADWCAVVAKDHPNSSNDISYALYAATGTSTPPGEHILVSGGDKGVSASSKLTLNSWAFLAATYDGASMKIYVNGTLVRSKAQSGSIVEVNAPLKIGGDWSGEMFTGIIDEVRVYNTALTQAQVQGDMSTPVDSTPPTVAMTAPAGGSTVSGPAVTVSAGASDNVAVAGVQFLLDGNNLGAGHHRPLPVHLGHHRRRQWPPHARRQGHRYQRQQHHLRRGRRDREQPGCHAAHGEHRVPGGGIEPQRHHHPVGQRGR